MRRVALLVLLACAPAFAADEPPLLASHVTHAATWKNGLAAITREVEMPSKPGTYAIAMPSAPVHGTLWVALPERASIAEISSTRSLSRDSLLDLACRAIGRTVTLDRGAPLEPLRGKLVSAPCDPATAPASPYGYPSPQGGLVVIETGTGLTVYPSLAITGLTVDGADASLLHDDGPRLLVRLGAVAGRTFEVTWMTRGLAWMPSARLELTSPTSGTLSSSALLVNEAEDLGAADMDLVSGPALFVAGNVDSPLAGSSLAAYFQAWTSGSGGYDVSRVAFQNSADNDSLRASGRSGTFAPSSADLAAEDASVRRIDRVTLAKGGSAWRPLWSDRVTLQHLYAWKVPAASRGGYDASADKPNPARHVLRLDNASANPWTSQPVEIVSDGVLVGQSKIPYTPAGSSVDVPIADALDLATSDAEWETSRVRDSDLGRDQASLSGELALTNLTGRDVAVEVVKELEGQGVQVDPPAEVKAVGKGLRSYNPLQRLTWRFTLKAGESAKLAYSYRTYV